MSFASTLDRRHVTLLLDQAAYMAQNVLLAIAVARVATQSDFGMFALVMAPYPLAIALTRSSTVELRFGLQKADRDPVERVGPQISVAIGAMFSLGTAALLLILSEGAPFLYVLAAGYPMVLLHDLGRYELVADRFVGKALATNITWVTLQGMITGAVMMQGEYSLEVIALAWVLGATVASLLSSRWLDLTVAVRTGALTAWWCQRRVAGALAFDSMLGSGMPSVLLFVLGATASTVDVASIRGAQLLLGPLAVVFASTRMWVYPTIVAADRSTVGVARRRARLSLVVVMLATAYSTLIAFLGPVIGPHVLGETWTDASRVLVLVAVERVLVGASVIPSLIVRLLAKSANTRLVRARMSIAALMLLAAVVGGHANGDVGYAVCIAVASLAALTIWWRLSTRALERIGSQRIPL